MPVYGKGPVPYEWLRRTSLCFSGVLFFAMVIPLAGCGSGDAPRAGLSYKEMVARAQREKSADARARRLAEIAFRQSRAGDEFGADATFDLARRACGREEIDETDTWLRTSVFLAEKLAQSGRKMEAIRVLEPALGAVNDLDDAEVSAGALAGIARVQALAGRQSAAKKTVARAEELLEQIDDLYGQTLVKGEIARAMHQLDRPEEVKRITGAAMELARSADDDRTRANCIALVASQLHALGDQQGARTALNEAVAAARAIADPYSKAHAMCDVAIRLGEAGYRGAAHKLLEEADLVAHKIPDRDLNLQMVEKVRTLMYRIPK